MKGSSGTAAKVIDKPTRQRWKQDPESVKADILKIATREIAAYGLSGSRINVIADKCKTSKRMIYYYFGDKEGLYRAVIESAYREVRDAEQELDLEHLEPITALETLIEFTFHHHSRHPDFIRLVMIENIHHGEFLRHSETIQALNAPAINRVERIYLRGVEAGCFRPGLTPLELHWFISAFSFFNVSNRASFSLIFGDALTTGDSQAMLAAHAKEMVLRFVLTPERACEYIGAG